MDDFNYPDVLVLCEKYPVIKTQYLYTINSVRDIIDKFEKGSESELYLLPNCLTRCKIYLESLYIERSRRKYDESKYDLVLDHIETELEELIDYLTEQTQLHDCNVKKKFKNAMLAYIQRGEENGVDFSEVKEDVINMSTSEEAHSSTEFNFDLFNY